MVTERYSRRNRRRTLYLVVAILLGICIMAVPALLNLILGPLFIQAGNGVYGGEPYAEPAPVDLTGDLLWLLIPAFIIASVLYMLFSRRTRWAGYDEAVKWIRR